MDWIAGVARFDKDLRFSDFLFRDDIKESLGEVFSFDGERFNCSVNLNVGTGLVRDELILFVEVRPWTDWGRGLLAHPILFVLTGGVVLGLWLSISPMPLNMLLIIPSSLGIGLYGFHRSYILSLLLRLVSSSCVDCQIKFLVL